MHSANQHSWVFDASYRMLVHGSQIQRGGSITTSIRELLGNLLEALRFVMVEQCLGFGKFLTLACIRLHDIGNPPQDAAFKLSIRALPVRPGSGDSLDSLSEPLGSDVSHGVGQVVPDFSGARVASIDNLLFSDVPFGPGNLDGVRSLGQDDAMHLLP